MVAKIQMSFEKFLKFIKTHHFEIVSSYQTTAGKLLYIHLCCLQTCQDMFIKISHNDYINRHALVIEPFEIGSVDIFTLASNQVFDYYKRPDIPASLDPKKHCLEPKSVARQLKRFSLLALDTDYHFVILHKQYMFIQTHKSQLKAFTTARPQYTLRMMPVFSLNTFFQKYANIGSYIKDIHKNRIRAFVSAIQIQLMKIEQIETLQSYRLRLQQVQQLNDQFENYRNKFQDRLNKQSLQLENIRQQIQQTERNTGRTAEIDLQLQYVTNDLKKQENVCEDVINKCQRVLKDIAQEQDEFCLMSDQVFFNNLAMIEQIIENMNTWNQAYSTLMKP